MHAIRPIHANLSFEVVTMCKSIRSIIFASIVGLSLIAGGCQPTNIQSAANTADKVQTSEFTFASAPSEASESALNQLAEIAKHLVDYQYDKGFIIAAVTPDGVSVKALGTLADLPDPAHTRMPIGSMTKVFVGMQLASLVLDGTVTLDTPITQCMPEGIAAPGSEDITLKMLTTHTSGLPRLQPSLLPNKSIDPTDPYTRVSVSDVWQDLAHTPREGMGTIQYSNYGEAVLGQALTQCAHAESWEALLAERVTNVLGLSSISIDADENIPQGYDMALLRQKPWTWNEKGMVPAGALKSNILDLSKIIQMSMSTKEYAGKSMLTKSQEVLFTDHSPNRTMSAIGMNWIHGLGAYSRFVPVPEAAEALKDITWHNGQTGTYNSYFGFIPGQNIGIVVLSNAATGNATAVGTLALAQLASNSSQNTQRVLNEVFKPRFTMSTEAMRVFEGEYLIEEVGLRFELRLDDDGNLMDVTHRLRVWPENETTLSYRFVNITIEFKTNADGTQEIIFTEGGKSTPLKKVR